MKRLRHPFLVVAGSVIALLVLFLVEEHFRGKWALARWQARMTAQGEKFQIEHLIPTPPLPADNGFAELVWAASQLQASPDLASMAPPGLRLVAPGKAIVVREQPEWKVQVKSGKGFTNMTWAAFGDELARINAPLQDAMAALRKPAFDGNLDYRMGFALMLPHLGRMKGLAQGLSAAALNDLHAGNLPAALEKMEAMLAAERCQENERLVISQLVRIAILQIAFNTTWQALHTPGWNDEQLARLQAGWQSQQFLPSLGRSLEMERAMGTLTYARIRQSPGELATLLSANQGVFGSGSGTTINSMGDVVDYLQENLPALCLNGVVLPLWQFAWSYHDELNGGQSLQRVIEWTRRAARERSGAEIRELVRQSEQRRPGLYDRMRFLLSNQTEASLMRSGPRALQAEAARELALAAIALQRYELRHGRPAPNLEALVPDFLPSLPWDYFDGRPLRYCLLPEGGFLLYSVGMDGRDDGGNPAPPTDPNSSLNLWNTRDAVWPRPASAAEIAAYEAKQEKRR